MLFFLFSCLGFFDLSDMLFGGFQQFPDTPIGNVERLMAYNKYWDAYEAAGEIIGKGGRSVESKAYRLRAQCALTMSMSKEAIQYATIVIDRKRVEGDEKNLCYQIRCKAYMQVGNFKDAEADSKKCRERNTIEEARAALNLYNELQNNLKNKQYKEAAERLDRLLSVATNAPELKLQRSKLAWDANDYGKFLEVAKDLPNTYPNDVELMYRLGIVNMCNGNLDEASKKIAAAMKYKGAPSEYKKAKEAVRDLSKYYINAKKAFSAKRISEVNSSLDNFFRQGLEYCSFKSDLMRNANIILAKTIRMEGDNNRTLNFLNDMISNYSNTIEFELERGEVSLEEGDYETAIFDFQAVLRKGNNPRARRGLEKAQNMKKEKTTIDYYKILNCSRDATQSEIKAAFRKATIKWHPDRYRDPVKKKEAETMMAKINNAYEILSDPRKKQMYDQGVDPDHPEYGGFEQNINPFDLFGGFGFPFNGGQFQQQKVQFGDGNGFHFEFHFG
jgi:Flp pilus assembly protein TadD